MHGRGRSGAAASAGGFEGAGAAVQAVGFAPSDVRASSAARRSQEAEEAPGAHVRSVSRCARVLQCGVWLSVGVRVCASAIACSIWR